MLGDNLAIAVALFAMWLAGLPSSPRRSFGLRRAEILAALLNGLGLVAVSIWIFVEAYRRLSGEPDVNGGWVLAVAFAGLLVNGVGVLVLSRSSAESLNVRAALRHLVADLAGSLGVIVAALAIVFTGWGYADPLAGAVVGVLVLASSWTILRDSVGILLEAAPADIDPAAVGRRMSEVEGVAEVHDLHIWTITSGFPALSAHVLVRPADDCHARRRQLEQVLREEFGIDHTTLQVEHGRGADGWVAVERLAGRAAPPAERRPERGSTEG